MSLRAKFLALFAALAVAPLIAIGIFDYLHSMRALEAVADRAEAFDGAQAKQAKEKVILADLRT